MLDKDTVEIKTWIGASYKNRMYMWYHGDVNEVKRVADLHGYTEENLFPLPIPITEERKFLVLDNPNLMLIGGFIIELN